jgi:Peptidase inhibitor family I36
MIIRRRSLLLLTLLVGCGSVSALGPTPADEGIVIYPHASFIGPAQGINVDVPNLGKVQGPCSTGAEGEVPSWNDCVSSVRVLPGWTATLYEDPDYKGRSMRLTGDAPDLTALGGPCKNSTFNDCVSSIRVARQ